jgi:hypothetical protein
MKRSTADICFLLSQLQKEFDVAIIDRNGFFEYTPGILRALVDPDHFMRLAFDLAKLKDCRFHNAEVLTGVVAAQPLLQQCGGTYAWKLDQGCTPPPSYSHEFLFMPFRFFYVVVVFVQLFRFRQLSYSSQFVVHTRPEGQHANTIKLPLLHFYHIRTPTTIL